MYIKCETLEEWKEQHIRFLDALDIGNAYNCEVPNSIPSLPYRAHPQFTITVFDRKITIWCDVNKQ